MKICPTCKQRNENDSDFCQFCGLSISGLSPASESNSALPAPPQFLGSHLREGSLVDGKYQVTRVLGEGGMGVVYLARDIHTQTDVVIKAIRTEYTHRKDFRDRILAEGRSLARIDHPNVVRLNAVVVEASGLYLVMQYIEGESLDRTIERHVQMRTPIPLNLSLRIFSQVLEGVAAAHQEGVIHRDLKPANILVRARDSVAKVTDFGIAKGEEDAKAGRGQTKGIIGSLLYMAPEQLTGQRDLDKRVDIYALGILLFELLSGHVPFDAPSEFEVMKMHLEAPLPRLSNLRPDIPPALDDVLQRACAKDRNLRFACCEDFLLALHRCFGTTGFFPQHSTIQQIQQYNTNIGPPPTRPVTEAVALQPAPAPIHANTAQGVSAEADEEKPYSLLTLAAIGVGLVAVLTLGGLAAAWQFGLLTPKPAKPQTASPPGSAQVRDAAPSRPEDSNLAKLIGPWKSDSGRQFNAVMSGDNLEFRIHDAAQFPNQGYVTSEARFSLTALPANPNTFLVADKIRPVPPANTHYDLQKARTSCQEVWSQVDDQPLHAQFDGTRLTIDAAKIEPDLKVFAIQGNTVTGCTNLRSVPASRIEVVLTRN